MQQLQSFESPDMKLVMDEARKLAIQYRHGLIDYAHLFIAIFSVDCEASRYCKDFETEKWKVWLQDDCPATGNETMADSVPLTVFAGRIIRHAYGIMYTNGDQPLSSVHLLLALLSINCELTEAVSKTGVVFENVAEQYYGKPVKRSSPFKPELRKTPYPAWRKFFITSLSRKKKVQKLYGLAYELYMYRLYEESISVCEAGLSLESDHHNLKLLRCYCYVDNRDFQLALTHVTNLLNDAAAPADLKITLACIYDEIGQHAQAAKILDEILEENPEEATALNNRGFNLYRQGQFAEAVPYYEKAISVDPAFAYPWDNLGFVKYKLGKVEEALDLIDSSLKLDKGNSFAYKYKGIIFLEQNNREEALKNFQLALMYGYTKKYGNEVLELMKNIC
jgi:tetratricopeptide (TPR) repeat protein